MAENSNIEWTDVTWNPVTGCTEKGPDCANCYSRPMSKRLAAMAKADRLAGRDPGKKSAYSLTVRDDGRWSGVVLTVEDALKEPFTWKKPCRVFVNSMSDLFWGDAEDLTEARRRGVEDPKPVPFEFIDRVFAVMAQCPQHTFQILTKRPARMAEYLVDRESWIAQEVEREQWAEGCDFDAREASLKEWPLPNVWLGTSVGNQKVADERIRHLMKCTAAVRFLSCEPMLGPIDLKLTDVDWPDYVSDTDPGRPLVHPSREGCEIDWVIVGGESGSGARPCDVAWIRSLVSECKSAGVPCFVKQIGSVPVIAPDVMDAWPNYPNFTHEGMADGMIRIKTGSKKGGDPSEWPEDLRVREFPQMIARGRENVG